MDGKEFRALRERLGVTQKALAARLETTVRTIRRWETGVSHVPKAAEIALSAGAAERVPVRREDTKAALTDEKLRSVFDKALRLIQKQGRLIDSAFGRGEVPEERWAYTLPRLLTREQDEWVDLLDTLTRSQRNDVLARARHLANPVRPQVRTERSRKRTRRR